MALSIDGGEGVDSMLINIDEGFSSIFGEISEKKEIGGSSKTSGKISMWSPILSERRFYNMERIHMISKNTKTAYNLERGKYLIR